MCVQFRGGGEGGSAQYHGSVQYQGGYHEYHGGYLQSREDIFSTMGISSVLGDIFSTMGDIVSTGEYLKYHGRCSVPWGDIMIHVGNIISTVGVFSTMKVPK